ncbi:MAG: hypothetical protein AAFY65_00820 [Pseudomonadota bacterium]
MRPGDVIEPWEEALDLSLFGDGYFHTFGAFAGDHDVLSVLADPDGPDWALPVWSHLGRAVP